MEAPNYGKMGDHTETVQVDYDPSRITYEQLLDIFWESHRPTDTSWSEQYKNVVFYHNEKQKTAALASKTTMGEKSGKTVRTEVAPLRSFTMAEDYHQKYILKGNGDLYKEMTRIYPRHEDVVNSTAAARLNGYAGHNGNKAQLALEVDSLGLSDSGRETLSALVRN